PTRWRSRSTHDLTRATAADPPPISTKPVIDVRDVRVRYGHREALHGISFDVRPNEIFGIIGPAQSGKTTLLKVLNRTLEFIPNARMTGEVRVGGEDIHRVRSVFELRRRIGMVAPLPVGL